MRVRAGFGVGVRAVGLLEYFFFGGEGYSGSGGGGVAHYVRHRCRRGELFVQWRGGGDVEWDERL